MEYKTGLASMFSIRARGETFSIERELRLPCRQCGCEAVHTCVGRDSYGRLVYVCSCGHRERVR